jgi:hypothetical protein
MHKMSDPELLIEQVAPGSSQTGAAGVPEHSAAHVPVRSSQSNHQHIPPTAPVDEPNLASIRVLEKLGFRRCGDMPGAFGRMFEYRHRHPAFAGYG